MSKRTIRPTRPVRKSGSWKGILFFFLFGMLLFVLFRDKPKTILPPASPYIAELYRDGKVIEEKEFDSFDQAKAFVGQKRGAVQRTTDERYLYLTGSGIGIADAPETLNIYADRTLKKRLTYVAPGSRLSLLTYGEQASRIEIAGLTGYVDSDRLTPYPLERSSNRSYYETRGDRLLHYIVADAGLGGLITAGQAPSSAPERTTTYVESKTLTKNLRQPTELTAKQLDAYIKKNAPDSPLIGTGKTFKQVERDHKVNAAYLLAHAIHESNYGRSEIARDKFNLFGVNATDIAPGQNATAYTSFEDSIRKTGKFIARDYLAEDGKYYRGAFLGNKARGMNVFYASDPYWSEKIAGILLKMNAV
ncbi:glucosaminidase domain-containing protein [Exiguobacterium sp. s192]|uniref:N-acetylglucosaminidase n=1 Tax=Exiguobacterium sp. s192 TaxID=2751206 RepID=UPI001BE9EB9F|nr:glucosaminidase domain-containing protein [Exiguobacterium sp. s192]